MITGAQSLSERPARDRIKSIFAPSRVIGQPTDRNQETSHIGAGTGSTFIQALSGHRVMMVTAWMTDSTQIANLMVQIGLASPAIDAGSEVGVYTDFAGQTRLQGASFDISLMKCLPRIADHSASW